MPGKERFRCAICGKEVLKYRSQICARVHCSRECRDASARMRRSADKAAR